jgi:hypothetical protein
MMASSLDALPDQVDVIERKLDGLSTRVDVVERKLDALSSSVDKRFDDVDKRFDDVRDAFVEQRQYTEFAFGTLQKQLTGQIAGLERGTLIRFDRLERKIDRILTAQQRAVRPRRPRKNR